MSLKRPSHLNLIWAFIGFMALGALVFFGVTVFFTNQRVSQLQDSVLRNVVEKRADHIVLDLVDQLHVQWTDLENLAAALPFSDSSNFRSMLEREVASRGRIAWAGYVNVHGDVIAASHFQREGENLSQEEWFLAAERGPTISFVDEPAGGKRLVMSTPINSSENVIAGYLTFHFHPDWLEKEFMQLLKSVSAELLVFDDRGRPALASFDCDPRNSHLASVRNTLAGYKTIAVEEWQGLGPRYLASVPVEASGSMPALGWRALVLIPPNQFDTETEILRLALYEILGAVALVLLLMSMGFVRIFLLPLHRLVDNADAIASGEDIVPHEDHRTAELSLLSSALSRLQGRIMLLEDRAARLREELDEKTAAEAKNASN